MNTEEELRDAFSAKMALRTYHAIKEIVPDPIRRRNINQVIIILMTMWKEVFNNSPEFIEAMIIYSAMTREGLKELEKRKSGEVIYL